MMSEWMHHDVSGLEYAVCKLKQELPGWWWSVANCSVSADATIAPDRTGPDAHLLQDREFDNGFSVDLAHPGTVAEALFAAIDLAKEAKARKVAEK